MSPGTLAGRLQRQVDDRVARHLVLDDVAAHPALERAVAGAQLGERCGLILELLVLRRREIGVDARDFLVGNLERTVLRELPLLVDELAILVDAHLVDDDLDARLVDVVAPPVHVVDAQDRLDVRQQMLRREPLADRVADVRRAAEAAADEHLEPDLALLVLVHPQADVVHGHGRAIVRRARHGDLELARQVRELGVQKRVLAQQLAVDARIGELVLRATRVLIRRDVAHAVARRLDRRDLDVGEVLKMSGASSSLIQLYWMFWRVVK